jgi:hypothetical protein
MNTGLLEELRVRRAAVAAIAVAMCIAVVPAANAITADGACCLPDHTCEDLLEIECEANGGTFISFDSSCAQITCDLTAAPMVSGAALLLTITLLLTAGWLALRGRGVLRGVLRDTGSRRPRR